MAKVNTSHQENLEELLQQLLLLKEVERKVAVAEEEAAVESPTSSIRFLDKTSLKN